MGKRGPQANSTERQLIVKWKTIFGWDDNKIATILGRSKRVIAQTMKAYQETGRFTFREASTVKLGRPSMTREQLEYLEGMLHQNPSAYIDEYRLELYEAFRLLWSAATIYRMIKRLGYSRKKLRTKAMQANPQHTLEFQELLATEGYTADQCVFYDEVGTDRTKLNRGFGWAKKGQKAFQPGFYVKGKHFSTIAAMDINGIITHITTPAAVNTEFSCAFAHEQLLPYMNAYPAPRSVLVLDNAAFHRSRSFLAPFEEADVRVLFTPPYQPYFQPIECTFSKLKAILRRNLQVWFLRGLTEGEMIALALSSITAQDARGWISNCGYEFAS